MSEKGGAIMKYDRMERSTYDTEAAHSESIASMLTPGEKLLWSGKPKKSVFILENVFQMLPFALIWLAFDAFFIVMMVKTSGSMPEGMWLFLIPFFALHLLPVWLWLSKVLTANKRYKNTEYCITDKRVIIKSGFIGMQVNSLMMKDIANVDMRRGILDTMFGVGDVYISTVGVPVATRNRASFGNAIIDIPDALEVMQLIQKVSYDIKSDIGFPNAMRPDSSPGYKTEYNPSSDRSSDGEIE